MAHSFHHSVSSARKFGGVAADFQPIHDWFDRTKSIYGNFRHRALRHHAEGVAMAVGVFGSTIKNSEGGDVEVAAIGRQHVTEDCGRVVSAADWFVGASFKRLTCKAVTAEQQAENSARKTGGKPADYLSLHRFLDQFDDGGPELVALRHHSWGLFDAEQHFGPVLTLSNGVFLPVRYVGEQHLLAHFGRLPGPLDYLERIAGEKWMVHAAGPAAREIAELTRHPEAVV